VQAAMEHAVLGDAGRIRPLLALRVGRLAGSPSHLVLRGALAVELVHSASLVVDDLPCMDDDLVRRGQPSVHAAFGEATAILAAHSLVGLAAKSCLTGCAESDLSDLAHFQCKLLSALDPDSLAGGQEMDLRQNGTHEEINERKTVPLFRLAVEAGLIRTPIDEASRFALRRFGREFGVAFQLVDDVLDGLPVRLPEALRTLRSAHEAVDGFGKDAEPLRELVEVLHARVNT